MPVTIEVPDVPVQPAVSVPAATSALIVVDMQNDFVSQGGALVVPDAAATVPVIATLLRRSRAAGVRIYYTQDTHQPGDPEFPIWGEHVLEGTWGWQIVDALRPPSGERGAVRVIQKLRYDGFFGTSLDHELRLAGIQTVIVCGTVANICVLHTAGSAAIRGYQVILPVDAVSALTPFDLQVAIRQVSFLYRGTITRSTALTFT
ncbi:MAG: cysteine hydrolase family protein [Armatimonadota bacterium]